MCGTCRDWHRRRIEDEARASEKQYGPSEEEIYEAISLGERWERVRAQRAGRPDTEVDAAFEEWRQKFEPTHLPWATPRVPGSDLW